MKHWPAKYRSLFVYLTDWADFTPTEARKAVEDAMARDMRKAA